MINFILLTIIWVVIGYVFAVATCITVNISTNRWLKKHSCPGIPKLTVKNLTDTVVLGSSLLGPLGGLMFIIAFGIVSIETGGATIQKRMEKFNDIVLWK